MTSFQIAISPKRRAAGRFISRVRRTLLKALTEEGARSGLKQADLARAIEVHRSVINRELRGTADLTLGRVAELAWALGKEPSFNLVDPPIVVGDNAPRIKVQTSSCIERHSKLQTATRSAAIRESYEAIA